VTSDRVIGAEPVAWFFTRRLSPVTGRGGVGLGRSNFHVWLLAAVRDHGRSRRKPETTAVGTKLYPVRFIIFVMPFHSEIQGTSSIFSDFYVEYVFQMCMIPATNRPHSKGKIMSRVSGFATMMAVALSFIAVSCAGTNFFKVPVPGAGAAVVASATTPAPAAAPVGFISTGTGSLILLGCAVALAATIGLANFVASKPPAA